jgi:hypothetical protein
MKKYTMMRQSKIRAKAAEEGAEAPDFPALDVVSSGALALASEGPRASKPLKRNVKETSKYSEHLPCSSCLFVNKKCDRLIAAIAQTGKSCSDS